MKVSIKCKSCKKDFQTLILGEVTSSEEECSYCGNWNYWKQPKNKIKKDKKETVIFFKKGQKIQKQIYFKGKVLDKQIQKIHSIVKGVIYLCDNEGRREEGITYDTNGNEIENLLLGFTSKIKLIKKTVSQ